MQEYQKRRLALAQRLSPNSVAIIPAATEVIRNGDAHYRFRQASDFYYLTGFNEPDALLLIEANGTSYLFNRPSDANAAQWTGARLGQDAAKIQLNMQEAYSIDTLNERLPDLLANRDAIYYTFGYDAVWDQCILRAYKCTQGKRNIHPPLAFNDIYAIISEMRLIKSKAEIACMQKAADLSVAAHLHVLQQCLNFQYEYQLEAEFLYHLQRNACRDVAYDCIVASGKNACILHYTNNNQPLAPNALILIDAGAEYQNYAADITRTYPINGQFSAEQRLIYELVLHAQRQGMSVVRPDAPWSKIQEVIVNTLTEGLVDLGILSGNIAELIETQAYKQFYMHNSGHWLGLDVHDCGTYQNKQQSRRLKPGMVLTVEPGLYFTPSDKLDPRWWNIGVRIEDDLLVTARGHTCLTAALPVTVQDCMCYTARN